MEYIFKLIDMSRIYGPDSYRFSCDSTIFENGEKDYLTDEITVDFQLVGDEPVIIEGYTRNIGDSSGVGLDEDTPWDTFVEGIFPGITEQIFDKISRDEIYN